MAKSVKAFKWKVTKCPKGCGAYWIHRVTIYKSKGACCRVYWSKTNPSFGHRANKPIPTFRMKYCHDTKKWMKHPTNPAWKDDHDKYPIKRCC